MFWNYLKVAYRNLLRHKVLSLINILGLASGMACCMLILIYVQDELSYDRYHSHTDDIYRVAIDTEIMGQRIHGPISPAPMGASLQADFKEVEDYVRLRPATLPHTLSIGDRRLFKEQIAFADNSLFSVFSFKLTKGDPAALLTRPNTIVLSQKLAYQFFQSQNPIGKTISYDNQMDLEVTGVMEEVPYNSHFRMNAVISLSTLISDKNQNWMSSNYYTYIRLKEGTEPNTVEEGLFDFAARHMDGPLQEFMGKGLKEMAEIGGSYKLFLQPLKDIHLHSHLNWEIQRNGDIKNIYIFSVIGILILLIACINFMNLSTARSATRAKEVGIRKVLGANRTMLIRQFMIESLIQAFFAWLVALAVVEISLPVFNHLLQKQIDVSGFQGLGLYGQMFIILVLASVVAGSYPAFFLSRFRPVAVLKGRLRIGARGTGFRRVLVVSQFAISMALIISLIVVFRQLDYMKNKDLGFNEKSLLILPIQSDQTRHRLPIVKTDILSHPDIIGVSASSYLPGSNTPSQNMYRNLEHPNKGPFPLWNLEVDHDFLEIMEMELVRGRNFSREVPTDSAAYVLNESAVKRLAMMDPVGKEIDRMNMNPSYRNPGPVIGVVRDFHIQGFSEKIKPMILSLSRNFLRYISVRYKPEKLETVVEFLKGKWDQIEPGQPFSYSLLDSDYQKVHQSDQRVGQILFFFTLLAIVIACLGLFGLSSFTSEQRTREIGIRKVLGASVLSIVLSMAGEFTRLILIANFIAWPLAWLVTSKWLEGFVYRVELNFWPFILASLFALGIALATVTIHALRAATANPVLALKYE